MHGLDDKIHSVVDADCKIEGKEVSRKSILHRGGKVGCNDSADCGGYRDGPEFGWVCVVFVEAEEVGVSEELVCLWWDLAGVNEVEEAVNVVVDVGIVEIDEGGEDVDGVGKKAGAFMLGRVFDGVADVAW